MPSFHETCQRMHSMTGTTGGWERTPHSPTRTTYVSILMYCDKLKINVMNITFVEIVWGYVREWHETLDGAIRIESFLIGCALVLACNETTTVLTN